MDFNIMTLDAIILILVLFYVFYVMKAHHEKHFCEIHNYLFRFFFISKGYG